MKAPRAIWYYGYNSWRPPYRNYVLPYRGGDEYGRLTFVIPVHPFGFLVWAYRYCPCSDCVEIREQTARMESS